MAQTDFHKLIRDFIPQIIDGDGQVAVVRQLNDGEFRTELVRKLHEEVNEFSSAPSIEELADIQEVVLALAGVLGKSAAQLEEARQKKRALRGGFERRLFLEVVRDR